MGLRQVAQRSLLKMSKPKIDGETRIEEYLNSHGLRVERFTKAEMRKSRTPDFRVYAGDELAFYCEVKTAQKDEWLEAQRVNSPGMVVGGPRHDPTYNRVSSYIHQAVGQFDAVNPAMDYPNVLAIVNGDRQAGFTDLIQVVTGNAYCESGEVIPMFREYSEGRIREAKLRVHLFLWLGEWTEGHPQKYFPDVHPDHHLSLCGYLGVSPTEIRRL